MRSMKPNLLHTLLAVAAVATPPVAAQEALPFTPPKRRTPRRTTTTVFDVPEANPRVQAAMIDVQLAAPMPVQVHPDVRFVVADVRPDRVPFSKSSRELAGDYRTAFAAGTQGPCPFCADRGLQSAFGALADHTPKRRVSFTGCNHTVNV